MDALWSSIARHAAQRPAAPALADGERTVSYGDLAQALAGARRIGGDDGAVALALDNGPAWAIADLALLAARRVCLPLPHFFTAAQQGHALDDAGARWLLTDRPAAYASRLGSAGISAVRRPDLDLGGTCIARFELRPSKRRELPAGTIKVTYTSGTTGTPKGVCLGAQAIGAVTQSLVGAAELGVRDRHVALLPLATLLENIGGVYAPLAVGACAVLPPLATFGRTADAATRGDALARVLHAHAATTSITVPELLAALCASLERGAPRPAALRFLAVGGARVSIELLERAAALGLPVFEGYGLSECASVVALNTPRAQRRGSVGRVLPHAEVRLDAGGEIHVRGATLIGYAGGEPLTAAWYATGDLGRIEDGFLYVTGRRRNVFVTSSGRNVAPEWVESELTASEAIAQAWVYGEARPWNSAVVTPAAAATPEDIDRAVERANLRLPDYARVARWVPSHEPFSAANGELTANGRVRRAALLARYGNLLDELYEGERI